jgi:TonB family protein
MYKPSSPSLSKFVSVAVVAAVLSSSALIVPVASASPSDWEKASEALVEKHMTVPKSANRKVRSATAVMEVTVSGDGKITSQQVTQSSGVEFVDEKVREALFDLKAFPALSGNAEDSQTFLIEMSYDKVKIQSDKVLRRAFIKKNGYSPSVRDYIVSVSADIQQS